MADRLVKWLSERGYQPVLLPETGMEPPDLYVFQDHRLRYWDKLKNYLPGRVAPPAINDSQLSDIQLVQTTQKNLAGTLSFIGNALRKLGIESGPNMDLSFAGTGELTFSLVGVTCKEVGLVEITKLVKNLKQNLLPEGYLEKGVIHIAYKYAYAQKLEMKRVDSGKFQGNITGVQVEQLMNIKTSGSVEVKNGDSLIFDSKGSTPAAFAYKAARLRVAGDGFDVLPEDMKHLSGGDEKVLSESKFYLPAPEFVLKVEKD
jgi:hypothetical protein